MQHFDSTKMSDDEYSFIKLYCTTVRADYPLIATIKHITDPTNLGVTNIIDAAEVATKIHAMEREFCAVIESLGSPTKRASKKSDLATPTQIAEIFTQSFFKLVDSSTKKAIVSYSGTPMHDGWSSGHPLQWQQVIKSLHDMQSQQKKQDNSGSSGIINALLNLLSVFPNSTHSWHEYDEYDENDDYWSVDEDGWDADEDFPPVA
jgi:hypothetical protein